MCVSDQKQKLALIQCYHLLPTALTCRHFWVLPGTLSGSGPFLFVFIFLFPSVWVLVSEIKHWIRKSWFWILKKATTILHPVLDLSYIGIFKETKVSFVVECPCLGFVYLMLIPWSHIVGKKKCSDAVPFSEGHPAKAPDVLSHGWWC